MSGHLSEAEIRAFASGQLPPLELLSADEHFATCHACRDRAASIAGLGPALGTLRSDLLPAGSHLSDDEVQKLADERPAAPGLQRAQAHVIECAACARQVADLKLMSMQEDRPPRLIYYAAAAAVLFAVALPALWFTSARREPVAPPTIAGVESLPAATQVVVRTALRAGIVEPPAFLRALAGRHEPLMGDATSQPFRVQAPLATAVVTDRPIFEWTPVPGKSRYAVAVFTEDLRLVVRSPQLEGSSWTPDQPLDRDRTYAWQVTAEYDGRTVTVPAPPEPQAKFRVVDQPTASLLQRMAIEHPTSHLLLGILYANAGVGTEAERELRQVPSNDPHASLARRTLERIQSVQ